MKKLFLTLAALSALGGTASAVTNANASPVSEAQSSGEVVTTSVHSTQSEQAPPRSEADLEFYYDHVDLEGPNVKVQVEAEVESL